MEDLLVFQEELLPSPLQHLWQVDPLQGDLGSQGPGSNFSLSPTGALVGNGYGRQHLVPG